MSSQYENSVGGNAGAGGTGSGGDRLDDGLDALDRLMMLVGGIALGAALMYLLDPEQGRRRRALWRDKLVSASNKTSDVVGKTTRDLTNRAQGLIAETAGMFRSREESGGQQDEQGQGQSGEASAQPS